MLCAVPMSVLSLVFSITRSMPRWNLEYPTGGVNAAAVIAYSTRPAAATLVCQERMIALFGALCVTTMLLKTGACTGNAGTTWGLARAGAGGEPAWGRELISL